MLKTPYQWFGGKARVANEVWDALGDVGHYVEPFFGGGAVFIQRPHEPHIETINDIDGFVANFWRAVKFEPDEVAAYLDWPVNEIDLEARHRWLCEMPGKTEFLERMKHEPKHYDAKRAGYWCWGLCAWIGSGWCGGEYWPGEAGKSKGEGVCDGANKRPSLCSGRGVHRRRPHLGDAGRGAHRPAQDLRDYMQALCDRMRRTQVCCGDWERICTDGATSHGKTVGVFLDPPYGVDDRDQTIYRCEDLSVASRVNQWCLDHTDQPRYKIVLAGYDTEHANLVEHGWREHAWKARGGMARQEQGKANKHRERLWFSPSCINEKLLWDMESDHET